MACMVTALLRFCRTICLPTALLRFQPDYVPAMLPQHCGEISILHAGGVPCHRRHAVRIALRINGFHIVIGQGNMLCHPAIRKLP